MALDPEIKSECPVSYSVVFDVWVFNKFGAYFGTGQIVLPDAVTNIIGTFLRAQQLAQHLCKKISDIRTSAATQAQYLPEFEPL